MLEFKDNPNQANVVELRNIGQTYDGGQNWIIKDLDFVIEDKPDQGQFVAILGMSGSGKSTMLRYIAGLQNPSEGKVLVHDKPVSRENRVSMVFQQYSSLPWMTVLDNVGLALRYQGIEKKERDARAMEMLIDMGLEGQENKFAQYPTLSGGQLQRVAIGRSLLANSKVLLMDEPFGALDIKTRFQMQDLLSKIWRKYDPTIVFVTHDIAEAVYLADDIYILRAQPGQIVEHIDIDLSMERNKQTKREVRFIELVHEVEDRMVSVAERTS